MTPRRQRALGWGGLALAVLAILIAVLVAVWDWNWFRGPVERAASARLHRQVTIAGDLDANLWSWQPSATAGSISIANPAWAGKDKLGSIDRLSVRMRLLPLLWGHVDLRQIRVDQPVFSLVSDAQGRRNWDFSDGAPKAPMKLPPIHSFVIRDGRLTYVDAERDINFQGTINASETLGEANRGFELVGRGKINGAPFKAEVVGGPLLNIERSKPYPFSADIQAGRTFITARGVVPKPFDLAQFHMVASARGPDMAELYAITGVALPNTPPYNLRGRLSRDDLIWRIQNLDGRVGDSDLSGDVSVDTAGERPMLKAELQSRSLDFDDLGALFGAAPKIGSNETASPEQVAVAKTLVAEQRLFPDAPLDVSRMRAMDADVTYKALSIRDTPIKLASGSVRVRLDDGLLHAEPLRLDLPQGRIEGRISLDARKATPFTELDLRLTNARIEQLIPVQYDGTSPLTGVVVGRARLSGSGNSVHKAFARANGEVMVVAPSGEIRKAFAELLGVNVVKGLGLLASKDNSTTPINCAVAHFETRNGVMTADHIVLDTGPVLVTGSGKVNLDSERMNFTLQGHNKKFRLVHVLLPVKVSGPVMAPKLGVEAGSAVAQGGVVVALGALLSPLAAILPFIDPGLAKDANCGALVAEAARAGAPVSLESVDGQALTPSISTGIIEINKADLMAKKNGRLVLGMALGLSAAIVGGALAHDDPMPKNPSAATRAAYVRHENFEKLGGAFKALNDEMRKSDPDKAVVANATRTISSLAAALPTWFPRGSGVEARAKSEAKPDIWQDAAGFTAAAAALRAQTTKLNQAALSGDMAAVKAQIRPTGGACKSCHDKYRQEKD